MSMFSICTAFMPDGKRQESLAELASAEKNFNSGIGVLFRRFFQCMIQPQIAWVITEWESEKHHNDAAQFLMQKRRDDLNFIIVANGLINSKARDKFLKLRKGRTAEMEEKLTWPPGRYILLDNPRQKIPQRMHRCERHQSIQSQNPL